MTSRVQKGGPVFRPVFKPKVRAATTKQVRTDEDHDVGSSETSLSLAGVISPSVISPVQIQISQDNATHISVATNTQIPTPLPQPIRPLSLAPAGPAGTAPTVIISPGEGTPQHHNDPTVLTSAMSPDSPSVSTVTPGLSNSVSLPISLPSSGFIPVRPYALRPSGMGNTLQSNDMIIGSGSPPTNTVEMIQSSIPASAPGQDTQILTGPVSQPDLFPPHPQRNSKRKAKCGSGAENQGDEIPREIRKQKKKRVTSRTPGPRRSKSTSVPPFDATADPGEDLDPTVVTMASLCSDTGQGRISSKAAEILSNHVAWKAQNRAKRIQMKTLMEAKKYGREEVAEETRNNQDSSSSVGPSLLVSIQEGPTHQDDFGSGFDYSQDLQASRFNVQVRIGPNGQTVIDEESLVVDRTEREDTTGYTHIVESDHTKFINSGTYGKRYRGSRWSAEETEMFYDALSQYGENYELIAYVLPGRDRKSCKNKFKAEDKKNSARINYCLRNRTPVDIATLSRMTGKNFSGPVPEIRIPLPQSNNVNPATHEGLDDPAPDCNTKASRQKCAADDELIVGEADNFMLVDI